MDFEKYILAPDANHLPVFEPLLVAVEFLFVAFAGVGLVSTILSLAYHRCNPALSRDFAMAISRKAGVWLTFGLLPLVTMAFLFGQVLYGTRYAALEVWMMVLPIAVVALGLLWFYRQRMNFWAGSLGVLALGAFLMPAINLLEFVQRPEQWPLWNPLIPDIYNTMLFPRLAIFFVGALLVTGATLLGIYFAWPEKRLGDDVPHQKTMRLWAVTLTHVGAVLLPALVVWDFALPAWGIQTVANVKASIPLIAALWLTAIGSGMLLIGGHAKRAGLWSLIALAAFALEVQRQHSVRMHAIADQVAVIRMESAERFAAFREQQEARYASNVPLDAEAAEKIYVEKCSSCHAFDRRVVGPAHKDVLPKYRGQRDTLVSFILNPTKIDPDYPAMPKVGLARREAVAVADYLMHKLDPPAPAPTSEGEVTP